MRTKEDSSERVVLLCPVKRFVRSLANVRAEESSCRSVSLGHDITQKEGKTYLTKAQPRLSIVIIAQMLMEREEDKQELVFCSRHRVFAL